MSSIRLPNRIDFLAVHNELLAVDVEEAMGTNPYDTGATLLYTEEGTLARVTVVWNNGMQRRELAAADGNWIAFEKSRKPNGGFDQLEEVWVEYQNPYLSGEYGEDPYDEES